MRWHMEQPYISMNLFLVLSFTFFALLLLKWLLSPPGLFTTHKHRSQPPSPPRLPVLGNLHQIGLHPHVSFQKLSRKYGPLMLLRLGKVPVLVVSSANAAREVMKTHDLVFSNRPNSKIFHRLFYDHRDVATAPYGEYWRQIKSLCLLHFLSNKRVRSFRSVREEEVADMITDIKISLESSGEVDLSMRLARLTIDVVGRVTLGKKYDGKRFFKDMLMEVGELSGVFDVEDYIPWLWWVNRVNGLDKTVERVAKEIDEFLEGVMEEHMEEEEKKKASSVDGVDQGKDDFLYILLSIQDDNALGFPIDRVSIKAILLDAFAAGTDTTYTVLEWAMTELLRHPDVMRRAQDEVRQIAGNKPSITEDDLEQLHFMKAVIKETLRLHPPGPLLLPREASQDAKVMGYDIAAGTQVIVNAWVIARDPTSWDSPEEFYPQRFLNSSIDFKGHDFEFIPFGAGRRGCPGIAFAIALDELALANLLHRFDWRLPDGLEKLVMTESTGITIHKKLPLIAAASAAAVSYIWA